MFKYIIGVFLLGAFLHAAPFQVGDSIQSFKLKDQNDKTHFVNSVDYKTIFFSAEMDVSKMLSNYLVKQKKGYLETNKALFVSDIHKMPKIITKLFALPKMRKYSYPIVLMYEENKVFPKQEESLTVLKTKNGKIDSIKYIKLEDENDAKIAEAFQ